MKTGIIKADDQKKKNGKKVVKTVGKTMAAFLAAGVALIALTDKVMTKACSQENEEEK